MERAFLGYTVIEVMIVLAITSILFFSAITVFDSQHTSTNFSQGMQDINSKVGDYVNDVNTSSYPGSEKFTCSFSTTSHRPVLTNSPGSGSACLFLGLAIEAFPAQTALQVYTILGNKDIYTGTTDSGSPALSIDTTNPEPAMLAAGTYQLTDNYPIEGGATIVYSKAVPASGGAASTYNIVGLYNGLPGDSAAYSSGTSSLVMRGYNAATAAQLNSCIEENIGVCTNTPISKWTVCFQDGGSKKQALLTVNSAPGGISTKISIMTACP